MAPTRLEIPVESFFEFGTTIVIEMYLLGDCRNDDPLIEETTKGDIGAVTDEAGPEFQFKFDHNAGLSSNTKQKFLDARNLKTEPPPRTQGWSKVGRIESEHSREQNSKKINGTVG